jgi:lipid-binding SYLF domain-containing protein
MQISKLAIGILALLAIGWLTTAASAGPREIDADARATLDEFYNRVGGSRELVHRAAGVLVFPTVIKAGFIWGGEYGEGKLFAHGRPPRYYNIVSGSFGFQLGAQAKSVIIVFMTPEALESFAAKDGWKIGVDGSVAVIVVGVGGDIDTNTITSPAVAFIQDQKGLMYNLTLEGSKISRIYR